MVAEQNFQSQGGDTTNGPHLHTYIPRADGSILVGGVAYIPQASGAAVAATIPISTATAVPVIVQAGGDAQALQPQAPPIVQQAVPLVYQQPVYPQQLQPVYPYAHYQAPHQHHVNYPSPYHITPQTSINGFPTFHIQQPAFNTIGLTGNEVLAQQLATAQGLEMNSKQEMKPADDDQFRMYWCRELDGTWTQRNRLTIDSGDIGDCRWYAMEGQFYAVRLPMA